MPFPVVLLQLLSHRYALSLSLAFASQLPPGGSLWLNSILCFLFIDPPFIGIASFQPRNRRVIFIIQQKRGAFCPSLVLGWNTIEISLFSFSSVCLHHKLPIRKFLRSSEQQIHIHTLYYCFLQLLPEEMSNVYYMWKLPWLIP